MKKVRVTVSDFMFEILKGDAEYFKIPLGKIGNTLFKYFIDKNLSKIELEESSGKKVQFNLSKENEDMFFDVLREKKASTEAELMRDIFFTYINNLKFKREEIIFNNTFKQIREAIKNNIKIGIKYHSTARIVNPYFIEVSSEPIYFVIVKKIKILEITEFLILKIYGIYKKKFILKIKNI